MLCSDGVRVAVCCWWWCVVWLVACAYVWAGGTGVCVGEAGGTGVGLVVGGAGVGLRT